MAQTDFILNSVDQHFEQDHPQRYVNIENRHKSKFNYSLWNFWLSVGASTILVLLLITISGLIPLILKHERSKNEIISNPFNKNIGESIENAPQHEFMPLSVLNSIPLELIEKVESLTLQWGANGSGKEVKYYFQVEFAKQDKEFETTTIGLSFRHKLIVTKDEATLYDPNEDKIGSIVFSQSEDITQRVIESETVVLDEKNENNESLPLRNLGSKNYRRYPANVDEGMPQSFFDAYCRYGCGGMSVTFPYYYRPFFGYGYPLVGTEAMFPQGYGGYPAAEILASQASSVPLQGISSPRPGGGGNGASNGQGIAGGSTYQLPV